MPAKKTSMPREGISTRPTDSSGRRATDADLGLSAAGAAASRARAAMQAVAREGTTSKAGGRPAVKMMPKIAPSEKRTLPANPNKPAEKRTLPAKSNQSVEKRILPYKPAKPAKPVQVIRTTQLYKPSPTKKK
jgi:hypothetical protein